MLASPLLPSPMFSPQHTSDDYRPSKDTEAFSSRLPPPVEFIEGSSSGTLAVVEGKYEVINASPKLSKAELLDPPKLPPHSSPIVATAASRLTSAKVKSLYPGTIDMAWPPSFSRGAGLYNSGNTCFLNSALQCLFHTPPLLKLLIVHKKDDCRAEGFCMACILRAVAIRAHNNQGAFSPSLITNNLQTIAKHLRKGRQEDTHEFLRYAIDALQKSCLAGYPPKMDTKLAETTWVHKLFGGRLRSRVTCHNCGHNSDTFDRILDLSLDIFKCNSLREALRRFVAVDHLKGVDKYKCEKCKKYVNAEKQFTIHEPPVVLTIHLKRFSPLGRKIGHPLQYDEALSLEPFMSSGQFGPSYSLYGVTCHAGGGPNSGHYYSFVKSREGRWWEMNDELIQMTGKATDKKNAYMLFYIQDKGQGLEAAMRIPSSNNTLSPAAPMKNGLAAGMKKRFQKDGGDDDEDKGVKVSPPFIGPLVPSSVVAKNDIHSSIIDPQALSLKSKIKAVAEDNARRTLENLGNYDSDDDLDPDKANNAVVENDHDDKIGVESKEKQTDPGRLTSDDAELLSSLPTVLTSSLAERPSVPAVTFYANSNVNKSKKRKSPDSDMENYNTPKKKSNPNEARTVGYHHVSGTNPFNQMSSRPMTYSRRHRRMGI